MSSVAQNIFLEYMKLYQALCDKKKIRPIEHIKVRLEDAIANERPVDDFELRGSSGDLKYSRIDDAKLDTVITPLAGISFLRILDLSFNEITNKGAILIAKFLKEDGMLEKLNLQSNLIGPQGGQTIGQALAFTSALNNFNISDNPIGDDGGLAIASSLQVNTSLSVLGMSGCGIKASGLISIAITLCQNNTVEDLDISNNLLSTSSLTQTLVSNVFTHIGSTLRLNYGLKKLKLSKLGLTDWVLCDFFATALAANQNIVTLDLSCNKITRDGGVALMKALTTQPSLNNLKLSCCSIQDEGAEALSEFLVVNRKLKSLWIDYNKIGSKGIIQIAEAIKKNLSLRYIAIWGNNWDAAACQAFVPLIGGVVSKLSIGGKQERFGSLKGRLGVDGTDVSFNMVEDKISVSHIPAKYVSYDS